MNKRPKLHAIGCVALLCAFARPACAQLDSLSDTSTQRIVRALTNASTYFHPDLYGEFAGLRDYAHHQYKAAAENFEYGAYYADKLSQLSLGLMYANGEGVQKDPARAYAWLTVAAERGYPTFVATRDRVKSELSAAQLEESEKILQELTSRYGDVVAKRRLAVQMHQGQMNVTGSHTGFDFGVTQLRLGNCASPTLIVGGEEWAQTGCASLSSRDHWNPEKYFASRDAQWNATVTVGPIDHAQKQAPARDPKQ